MYSFRAVIVSKIAVMLSTYQIVGEPTQWGIGGQCRMFTGDVTDSPALGRALGQRGTGLRFCLEPLKIDQSDFIKKGFARQSRAEANL
jgi:hypothetical protein